LPWHKYQDLLIPFCILNNHWTSTSDKHTQLIAHYDF
jgi:hypothetical protein